MHLGTSRLYLSPHPRRKKVEKEEEEEEKGVISPIGQSVYLSLYLFIYLYFIWQRTTL